MAEIIKTDMGHTYEVLTDWIRLTISEDGEGWGIRDDDTGEFHDIRDFNASLYIEWYDDEDGHSCPLSYFKDDICFEVDADTEYGRFLREIADPDKEEEE